LPDVAARAELVASGEPGVEPPTVAEEEERDLELAREYEVRVLALDAESLIQKASGEHARDVLREVALEMERGIARDRLLVLVEQGGVAEHGIDVRRLAHPAAQHVERGPARQTALAFLLTLVGVEQRHARVAHRREIDVGPLARPALDLD